MVQVKLKKVYGIGDWKKFKEEWGKTSNFAALTGFLHAGLGMIDMESEEFGDAIRFYLRVARWIDYHPDYPLHYELGKKAYQVLVSRIGSVIYSLQPLSSMKLKPVFEDLIGFFAEMSSAEKKLRWKVVYESKEQPYQKEMKSLLMGLWEGGVGRGELRFAKKILLENKEKIVKALVNARLFQLILRDNIFEAIPVLKEDIYWQITWHTPVSILEEFTKRFSGVPTSHERTLLIEKPWMIEELDSLGSKGFEFALNLAGSELVDKEEIFTLEELIVKRDTPPPLKVKLF